MEKNRFYKNFYVYLNHNGECFLKVETNVNGHVNSFAFNISLDDMNKIKKILNIYDYDVREVLENGK